MRRCCEKYESPTTCPECGRKITRARPWAPERRRVLTSPGGIDGILAHDRPLGGSIRTRDDDYLDGYDGDPVDRYDERLEGPLGAFKFGRWST